MILKESHLKRSRSTSAVLGAVALVLLSGCLETYTTLQTNGRRLGGNVEDAASQTSGAPGTTTPTPNPGEGGGNSGGPGATPLGCGTSHTASSVELDSGYEVTFNGPVVIGRYSVPPCPIYVNTQGQSVTVTSVTHPAISSAQMILTFEADTNPNSGQPYDPSESTYAASLRKSVPFTRTASATPTLLQLTKFESSRKATNTYPCLNIELTDELIFLNSAPAADALAPPNSGPENLKQSSLSSTEISNNLWRWAPAQGMSLPQNTPALNSVIDQLCGARFWLSTRSNLSSGQRYVSHPIGTPDSNGGYPSTYGAFRASVIADYLTALLNPNEPLQLRQLGMACFVQNIALTAVGFVLGGYASDESGGQGGGLLLASLVASLVMPANSVIRNGITTAIQNKRFSETTYLYRSTLNNTVYYGTPSYGANDYPDCVTGSGFFWGHGEMVYCTVKPNAAVAATAALLNRDIGVGGGYQEIASGMYLPNVFFFLQVPALRTLANYDAVMEYIERYLRDGTQCYAPNNAATMLSEFQSSINRHNAAAAANNWAPIALSYATDRLNYIASRVGYYSMSHHNEMIYRWLLNYYGVNRP